ncbi:MAG TPA: NTP transferase domain-containing protein [Armatimonadota bacterium]|nr:NTP transferase domain-containing protein [Armatimonadota bacterium]HPP74931.1 NTP transferase domain-containing protein [Armatimonadota bacterium]
MSFYAIILAAGKGKRMRDENTPAEFPKVLKQVNGRPLVSYVIDTLKASGIDDITIIVGFGADYVKNALGSGFRFVTQKEQLGSGHAVAIAKDALADYTGHVIIMCGDSPLFRKETISALKNQHLESGAVITLVSAELADPTGYGRIKRLPSGEIAGVVEEKCASPEEKTIKEINGGAYAFNSAWLWSNIDKIERNEANEFNLTYLVSVAVSQGQKVEAVQAAPEEVMGVNTTEDLQRVEGILLKRSGR